MKKLLLTLCSFVIIAGFSSLFAFGGGIGGCSGVSSPVVSPSTNNPTLKCPDYASTVTASGNACGNQPYKMIVKNTGCNGDIYFTISGNGNDLCDWYIESNLTGNKFGQGQTGQIGPINASVEGTVFDLVVDGTDNPNGQITVYQNGVQVAQSGPGHMMFSAHVFISDATMTVHAPSGAITKTVGQCNDFIMKVPLTNNDFCSTKSIQLPWDIKCDEDGSIIAQGVHTVIIDPKVPTSASDLVDISWNASSCTFDVTPKNDCGTADIGTTFSITPDPTTLTVCGTGTENFQVQYNGVTNGLNCWNTAGAATNFTYDTTIAVGQFTQATSPYGGNGNAAHFHIPASNDGGNATSFQLCINIDNFCMQFSGGSAQTDYAFYVEVLVGGVEVILDGPLYGTGFTPNNMPYQLCLNLSDLPSGFNQTDDIDIYVFPNVFNDGAGTDTKYTNNCSSDINWKADISADLQTTFDGMIGTPISNVYDYNGGAGVNYNCAATGTGGGMNGPTTLCVGDTTTYTAPAGGTWSTSDPSIATVDNTGEVAPIAAGTVKIYHLYGSSSCNNGDSIKVTVSDSPTFSISSDDPSCGKNDGKIVITATGGSTISDYSINNGQTSQGNGTFNNLSAGTYNILVTSPGGCTATDQVTIATPGGVLIDSITKQNASCAGVRDGSATVYASGGNPPYTYTWTPSGGTSKTISGLPGGTYTVVVKDGSGCSIQGQVTITEPNPIVIKDSITNTKCGEDIGAINLTVSGGSGNYTYNWVNGGSTSNIADSLGVGDYIVTVSDGSCSITDTFTVGMDNSFYIETVPDSAVIDLGESVDMHLFVDPNVTVDSIQWSPLDGLNCSDCKDLTATPDVTTDYVVTVTDDKGCISRDTVEIRVIQPCPQIFVPNTFSPNGDKNNDLQCVLGQDCIVSLNFTIYNRWGEMVFHTEDSQECWDGRYRGKLVQTGVYVYKLRAKLKSGKVVVKTGNITVVR